MGEQGYRKYSTPYHYERWNYFVPDSFGRRQLRILEDFIGLQEGEA